MIVEWSREALDDLDDTSDYVGAEDRNAAAKLVLRVASLVETLLARHPAMGRPGRLNGTRELIVSGTRYIAIYRVDRGAIEIMRVYHTSQDWPPRSSSD